jgi:hypothetical protein
MRAWMVARTVALAFRAISIAVAVLAAGACAGHGASSESDDGPLASSAEELCDRPIEPRVECVFDLGGGEVVASFGYVSPNTIPVSVPVGPQNFVSPGPQDRGQKTMFFPGRHDREKR